MIVLRLFVIVAACALILPVAWAGAPRERPNILWIVSEDNSPDCVGRYGDPLARTPNIDRLARQGVAFSKTHAAAPVCSVSRASIITGMYASSLGLQHHRSSYPLPARVRLFPEYLRDAEYFTTNNDKRDYNTPPPYPRAWNQASSDAHWRHRAPGQPFFAEFNFIESHESSVYTRRQLVTDPGKVRVPAYLPDTAEVRADIAQYCDSVARVDARVGEVLAQLAADGLEEDTIVFYFSDHGGGIAGSKRFPFHHGTHMSMVARFPKKYRHLAPRSSRGWVAELVSGVDLAPTMLSLAGLPVPDYMQGRAFAGPARVAASSYVFATRDRLDERYEFSRAAIHERFRYVRHYRPDLTNGRPAWSHLSASMREWRRLWQEGKLNPTQRAFFEPRPAEQLFDSISDPDNVRDLASDPAYRKILAASRAALREHQLAVRDAGFMPEPLMVELANSRSPAEVAASEAHYPLAELVDFIDAVQLAPGGASDRLSVAIRHPLPVFRYWAAILSLHAKDPPVLVPLLRDANATVRLAAAEIIIQQNEPSRDDAWREVIAALGPDRSQALHLTAGNIVADQVDRPQAALAALRNLLPSSIQPLGAGQHPYDIAGLLQAAEGKSNAFLDAFDKRFGFTREPGS